MPRRATPKLAVNHNTCISLCRWDACDEDIGRKYLITRFVSAHAGRDTGRAAPVEVQPFTSKDILREVMAFFKAFKCAVLAVQAPKKCCVGLDICSLEDATAISKP